MATRSARFARRHMILVACLGLASQCLYAPEKHVIAHEAEYIIVGTLDPDPVFPWLDGWHMNGVITVHEILYGDRLPEKIRFRCVLEWRYLKPWWPPPRYTKVFSQKALWFLRRFDERTWESALNTDPGIRFLSDRPYWEDYIRQIKLPTRTRLDAATPATSVRPSK